MADISPAQAAGAYQSQMRMLTGPGEDGGMDAGDAGGSASFAGLLKNAIDSVASTQHNAENLQMKSLDGKAEVADLVTAVSDASLSLSMVVAIRDRVISAYQNIMSMPI